MHQSLKAVITAIFLVFTWTLVNGLFAKIRNKWKKSKGYKGEGIIIINASDKGEGIFIIDAFDKDNDQWFTNI